MIAEHLPHFLFLIIGTAGASFAAGAEMGAYALNRVRLNLRARSAGGTPKLLSSARMLHDELANPTRTLAALLLTYNLMSYIAAEGLTGLLHDLLGLNEVQTLLFTVFIATPILFAINDAGPKEVFRLAGERLMYPLAPLLRLQRVILQYTLVLPAVQWLAHAADRLLPGGAAFDVQTPRQNVAELLKEGAKHGVISETQASLLDRAMSLRDTSVGDEMVPWPRCRVIQDDWSRSRVLDFISAYPQSRFPLVNSKGAILGVVDALDICVTPNATLAQLCRPHVVVEPDMSVRAALSRLNDADARLAIVKLRGKPVGLVTEKDLIEPLTGEIAAW